MVAVPDDTPQPQGRLERQEARQAKRLERQKDRELRKAIRAFIRGR